MPAGHVPSEPVLVPRGEAEDNKDPRTREMLLESGSASADPRLAPFYLEALEKLAQGQRYTGWVFSTGSVVQVILAAPKGWTSLDAGGERIEGPDEDGLQ